MATCGCVVSIQATRGLCARPSGLAITVQASPDARNVEDGKDQAHDPNRDPDPGDDEEKDDPDDDECKSGTDHEPWRSQKLCRETRIHVVCVALLIPANAAVLGTNYSAALSRFSLQANASLELPSASVAAPAS
jgi:hypothetical protein